MSGGSVGCLECSPPPSRPAGEPPQREARRFSQPLAICSVGIGAQLSEAPTLSVTEAVVRPVSVTTWSAQAHSSAIRPSPRRQQVCEEGGVSSDI